MIRKVLLMVLLALFLTSTLTLALRIQLVKSQPRTWTVDDDGTADFHTIQEAINAANDGDTIYVHNGTYYENIVVNKTVSLVGENRSNTIIDGNETLAEMGVVWLQSDNSSITGFTIRNGGYGIRVLGSYGYSPKYTGHMIEDNYIVENFYGGIFLKACANNTVSNNIIANNTLFGIHLHHAGNNMLINNTVVNNGHGIDFYGNSNDNILRNNNMTDNKYNFGLIMRGETRQWLWSQPEKPGIVNDVDASNTVNGKPVYYLINQSNIRIPPDAGYVWLNNCTNITVEGCDLSHNLQGILLLFCNNASIINNNITNNVYGIFIGVFSSNNTLRENRLKDNLNGVYLDDYSKSTTMRDNDISGGNMNFGVTPYNWGRISSWSDLDDIDSSNVVDGKAIIYWINKQNQAVPTNAGYVMLINSSNILIEGLNLSNNLQNIFLLGSNNTIIANNTISDSICGIDVNYCGWTDRETGTRYEFYSFNTTIKGNIVLDNGVGIRVISDNSTISNNTLYRNPLGILADTSNSVISRNMVIASNMSATYPGPDLFIFYYPEWPWEYSIELTQMEIGGIIVGGGCNVIYGNTIRDSFQGLVMCDFYRSKYGSQNLIFHNNFINNTPLQAVGAPHASNNYDNGYPSGGNYWSNYNGTDSYNGLGQNEVGSDGIGDTPFTAFPVTAYNVTDNYPLMAPIEIFDVGIDAVVEVVSNSSLSYFNLDLTQKTLSFNVTGNDGEIGFCRLTIPNTIIQNLWQENYTVYFDGEPLPFRGWKDETNTYIYINHINPEHKITIVPELQPTIILSALMILTMFSVAIVKKTAKLNR